MELRTKLENELTHARVMREAWSVVVQGLETTLMALEKLMPQPGATAEGAAGQRPRSNAVAVADAVPMAGEQVLVKEQPDAAKNGVYVVAPNEPVSKAIPEGWVRVSTLAERRGCTGKNMANMLKRRNVHLRVLKGVHGGPTIVHEATALTALDGTVAAELQPGTIAVNTLATEFGLTPTGMRGRLERLGVVTVRLTSRGNPLVVNEEAARAALANYRDRRKDNTPPAPKAKRTKKEQRPFDEPRPIVKAGPVDHWQPVQGVNDRYVSMEQAAKDLNVNMDWLRMVKKSGGIFGAPDWINWNQLEAYLKHPDFDAPLIDKER